MEVGNLVKLEPELPDIAHAIQPDLSREHCQLEVEAVTEPLSGRFAVGDAKHDEGGTLADECAVCAEYIGDGHE